MAERSKRSIQLPARFQDADEIWEQMTRVEKQTVHRIYRPLRRRDVTKQLADKDVYLYWPDDDKWYRANVEKIFFQTSSAYIHYPEDDTYEEINLKQLIKDKHVAFIETKDKATKLRHGEKPVVDDGTAVFFKFEDEPDSSEDIGSDDWVNESDLDDGDENDDEMSEGAEEVDREDEVKEKALKGKAPKQVSLAEQARRAKSQPEKRVAKPATLQKEAGPLPPPGLQPLRSKKFSSSSPKANASSAGTSLGSKRISATEMGRASSLTSSLNKAGSSKVSSAASLASQGSGSQPSTDEEMRKKARDQLIAALTLAIDEVKNRGLDEKCGDGTTPDAAQAREVARMIEVELFGLQNELSSVYKNKFRSLIFNLKDVNNELRLRVLFGDIAPSHLVRMEAVEMASASMSAWRQKKAEEQSKSKFLTTEAAAKFSTAAAAQLAETQVLDKQPVANIEIPVASAGGLDPGSSGAIPLEEPLADGGALSPSVPSTQVLGKRKSIDALPSPSAGADSFGQGPVNEPKAAMVLGPSAQRVTLKPIEAVPLNYESLADPSAFDPDDDYFTSTYESSDVDNVEGMMPLLGSTGDLQSTSGGSKPGDEVWLGSIGGQVDHGVVSSLRCNFVCGLGDLASMIGGSNTLEVKGTIKMAALETFLEDIRSKSKTRIVTLGHIRSSLAIEGMERGFSDLVSVYSSSAKAGVCHPLPGLEGYLLSSSPLARRLIKTVRMSLPSHLNQLIDLGHDLSPRELLLIIVHRKDFTAPRVIKPSLLQASLQPAPPPQPGGRPFDPRNRNPAEDNQRPYDPRAKAAPATVSLGPPSIPPAPPPVMSLSGLGALAAALGVKPDPPPSPPRPPLSLDLSALGALAQAVGVKVEPTHRPPPPVIPVNPGPIPMARSAPYGPYSEDYDRDFILAMRNYQA